MKPSLSLLPVFSALFLISCSSTPEAPPPERVTDVIECSYPDNPSQAAPEWVCNEALDGYEVAAVGVTEKSKAGIAFMEQIAATNARVKLAQQIRVQVQNMVKTFLETTGSGDSETVDRANTSVTRQITDESLAGSKVVKKITNKLGTLYVLVAIDETEFNSLTSDALSTSMDNDNALWQQFRAQQSQQELQDAILNAK